ncbi:MAG: hypothetical protein FWF79_04485 [Defluviitaleaceae bacterium]|nr:hypothetical protein [Defluviitaleaceae bacterium]
MIFKGRGQARVFVTMLIFMVMAGVIIPRATGVENHAEEVIAELTALNQAAIELALEAGQSEMLLQYGDIDVSQSGIEFYIQNNSGEDYRYGYKGSLAKYDSGELTAVPVIVPSDLDSSLYRTVAGGTISRSAALLFHWYGTLPPGRYIYIREFLPINANQPGEFLFLEFEITEETPRF